MLKAFRITDGHGFHLALPNGWTVSVQWGIYNDCDNHLSRQGDLSDSEAGEAGSDTAEVWSWRNATRRQSFPDAPLPLQTVDQVLDFIAQVRAF